GADDLQHERAGHPGGQEDHPVDDDGTREAGRPPGDELRQRTAGDALPARRDAEDHPGGVLNGFRVQGSGFSGGRTDGRPAMAPAPLPLAEPPYYSVPVHTV